MGCHVIGKVKYSTSRMYNFQLVQTAWQSIQHSSKTKIAIGAVQCNFSNDIFLWNDTARGRLSSHTYLVTVHAAAQELTKIVIFSTWNSQYLHQAYMTPVVYLLKLGVFA